MSHIEIKKTYFENGNIKAETHYRNNKLERESKWYYENGLPNEAEDIQIASSIIALGHIMGFEVLAEGVETKEQLKFLASKGCDVYQGYCKSKPVPAEEIVKLFT